MKHFFTFIILFSITLNAQTALYVSKSGSSTPPYSSWETAANTISLAYEAANNDDTIYVANGNYKENLYLKKRLIIIGESSDNTVLDGRNMGEVALRTDSTLTLLNFRIFAKGLDFGYDNTAFWYGREDVVLKNVRIDSSTVAVQGNSGLIVSDCLLMNVKFAISFTNYKMENSASINNSIIVPTNGSTAIMPDQFGNVKITNCIFTPGAPEQFISAFATGFDLRSFEFRNNIVNYAAYIGVKVDNVIDSIIIENNVFSNQFRTTIIVAGGVYMYRRNNPVIRNNIFYKCFRGANTYENGNDKEVYLDYNGYFGNTHNTLGVGPGEHAVFADPMFVQEGLDEGMSEFDYRLQMYSPMIDAGHPDIKDKDGTRSDIGAFGGPGGESYSRL